MTNSEIAAIFYKLANLLEIKGDNPYKISAYRNAANTISSLNTPIIQLIKDGEDLTQLPYIGKEIAKKINEIVTTGKLEKLQKLEKEIPPSIEELLSIKGLGPKRVKILYDKLHISNINELKEAALNNKISGLKGFGKKIEKKILESISA